MTDERKTSMHHLTLGKLRGLQQIANDRGIFAISALDHRGSLEKMLRQMLGTDSLPWDLVVQEKERLTRALAPYSTAVLYDPVYSVGPMLARGVVSGSAGILVAREQSGYESTTEGRSTLLQPGWSVEAIKRIGASAVKLLVLYHPDAPVARKQEAIIEQVAEECQQQDIAFLLEPMSYCLEPGQKKSDPEFAARKPEIVLETVRRLGHLGVDVLKLEFPTEPSYEQDQQKMQDVCRKITEAISVPWVLLSAGVDFATFQRQVEIACASGASGFLAGRAIWQEAMQLPDPVEREKFLNTIAVSRLRILVQIASYRATPWQDRIEPHRLPHLQEGWYATFS
jgi:tagatose 1,6-diphosphate aldolase